MAQDAPPPSWVSYEGTGSTVVTVTSEINVAIPSALGELYGIPISDRTDIRAVPHMGVNRSNHPASYLFSHLVGRHADRWYFERPPDWDGESTEWVVHAHPENVHRQLPAPGGAGAGSR